MEQFPRKAWKWSGWLWPIIAQEVLGGFGDINQNYSRRRGFSTLEYKLRLMSTVKKMPLTLEMDANGRRGSDIHALEALGSRSRVL